MANYLPVSGEFTMLSQSNINMLDLAYTHAQSAKKKTSLEVVFIKLYEKFIQTGKLSALEEKTVKDYLAVYRSEFALLKKRAKLNNQIDENVAASKQSARDNFKAQAICFYDASIRFAQERKKLNNNLVSTLSIYRAFLLGLGVFNSNEVKLVYPHIRIFARGEENKKILGLRLIKHEEMKVSMFFILRKINEKKRIVPVLQVNDVSYFTNYSSKRSKILELLTFHINQLKEDDKNRFLEYKVRYTDLAIADEILSVEQAEHNMEFNEKMIFFPLSF